RRPLQHTSFGRTPQNIDQPFDWFPGPVKYLLWKWNEVEFDHSWTWNGFTFDGQWCPPSRACTLPGLAVLRSRLRFDQETFQIQHFSSCSDIRFYQSESLQKVRRISLV